MERRREDWHCVALCGACTRRIFGRPYTAIPEVSEIAFESRRIRVERVNRLACRAISASAELMVWYTHSSADDCRADV